MRKREVYVDWMKAIGMLFIVWGHCFPPPLINLIYAFNVPLFFVISGFLSRRDEPLGVCWKKCFGNLLIPYLILAFLHCAGFLVKHVGDGKWLWSAVAILTGFHNLNDAPGCSNLWFVYTLVVIKLLFCVFGKSNKGVIFLSFLSLVGIAACKLTGFNISWAVTDAFIAMPFFIAGNLLSYNFKSAYNSLVTTVGGLGGLLRLVLVAVLIALTYGISYYNGMARMFCGEYGNSFVLFMFAAVAGILLVLVISLGLQKYDIKAVRIISVGSLVILAYHNEIKHPIMKLINNADMDVLLENIAVFLCAFVVVLAFIPIILILQRIFPIVLGTTRAKTLKQ